MAIKWIKTPHKGLRYYEHLNRRHGKKKDRYYSVRFKTDGKDYTYGIGWWSDGIPEEALKNDQNMGFEEYALTQLKQYKANVKSGSGPKSPKEKRKFAEERAAQKQTEQVRLERESVTFGSFFKDIYLPQAKIDKKDRSVTREEGLFNNWIKDIMGSLPMKDIAPFTLEKLKHHMAGSQQSPRSIEYALAVIRQVFNAARRSGHCLGESPTANVKVPKIDNGRMRFLTRDEAEALLAALKNKSPDVHDMTLLSLHVGLRFGEIASLTWQDIYLDKGILTIRDAKSGSRYAFLTSQATDILKNRPQGKPSEYVFTDRKGKKLTKISHSFFRVVDNLKLNDGIDDPRLQICFHSCRHSYASWLIEQGTDLYTVQKLLGHKTNIMTQRYAHLSENKLRDAAKALGQVWQNHAGLKEAGQVVNFTK